MFCKQCGKQLKDGAPFCMFCGTKQVERSDVRQEEKLPAPQSGGAGELSETIGWKTPQLPGQEVLKEEETVEQMPGSGLSVREAPVQEMTEAACVNCGGSLKPGASFCMRCGAKQTQVAAENPFTYISENGFGETRPEKRKGKAKIVLLSALAVLLLLAIGAGAVILINPGGWGDRILSAFTGNFGARDAQADADNENDAEETPLLTPVSTSPFETPAASEAPTPQPVTAARITEGYYQLCTTDFSYVLYLALNTNGTVSVRLGSDYSDPQTGVYISEERVGGGSYRLDGYWSAIGLDQTKTPRVLSTVTVGADYTWIFESVGGQVYRIRSAGDPGIVLGRAGVLPIPETYDPLSETQKWVLLSVTDSTFDSATSGTRLSVDELIPRLDSEYINIELLYTMAYDQTEMGYIRNGIYALSGKIFQTDQYKNYYFRFSWYSPITEDVYSLFNNYQESNLKVCTEYERQMGWRK